MGWPRPPVSGPKTAGVNMVGATVESGSCRAQLAAARGYRGELTTVALVKTIAAVHNTITFRIFFSNTYLAGTLENEAGTRHHWKAITHGLLSTLCAGGILPTCQRICYQFYLGFGWAWQSRSFSELWRFHSQLCSSSSPGWFCWLDLQLLCWAE